MMTIKKEKLNFYLYTFSLTTLALGLVKGQLKEQNYFSLYLFTRQTVVLVNIYFIIVFWTGKENNKYFSFITFINSTLTMVLYAIGKGSQQSFFNYKPGFSNLVAILEHYILMPIFIIYYFAADITSLKLKQFYIGSIYPLIYFVISMILGVASGDEKFPYDALKKFNTEKIKFFIFASIITIFIVSTSLLSIFFKNKTLNDEQIFFLKRPKKRRKWTMTFFFAVLNE